VVQRSFKLTVHLIPNRQVLLKFGDEQWPVTAAFDRGFLRANDVITFVLVTAIRADKNVVGFEVTVQDAGRMGRRQAIFRLQDKIQSPLPFQFPAVDEFAQRLARHAFHGKKDGIVCKNADIENGYNIRMCDLGEISCFSQQSRSKVTRSR
jgi:hypothetical protein